MKRVAFCFLLLLLASVGYAQGFRINEFHGDLTLDKDGTLHVTERIEVVFTEQHHGIFRDIPIAYDNGKGFSRTLDIYNFRVTDAQGKPLSRLISHQDENIDIRIGDKDTYEPVGVPLTYVISYDCFGQMNWFDTGSEWKPYCELYWNLTGHEWEEAMDKVTFTVSFPEVPEHGDVRARVFTGPYGSRQFQELSGVHSETRDAELGTSMELSRKGLSGGLERAMPAGEELTLVLDLPSTTITQPTFGQQALRFVHTNLGLAIPLVVIVFMFLMWARYGNDPAPKPVAVQFEPPDGISGSEIGALIDEKVDPRDLAAGLISLAVKGYLKITPVEEGLVFKKRTATMTITGNTGKPLTAFEELLLQKLRNCNQTIDETELRTHVAPHLVELKNSLYDALVGRGYYLKNPNTVRASWLVGGIVAIIGLGVLCTALNPTHEPLPSFIGGGLAIIPLVLFSRIMPKRTDAGAEAQRKSVGFEEFIRRARGKEFDWMSQKQPTAALFEEYLPHAIAFGLAVEWATAFDGILREMPSWYGAPYGTPYSPMYFGNDMGMITNSLAAAATTPPRSSGGSGGSSGFGGGGFSGGGFGGGGGGSW